MLIEHQNKDPSLLLFSECLGKRLQEQTPFLYRASFYLFYFLPVLLANSNQLNVSTSIPHSLPWDSYVSLMCLLLTISSSSPLSCLTEISRLTSQPVYWVLARSPYPKDFLCITDPPYSTFAL